jgi:hypothetical protein
MMRKLLDLTCADYGFMMMEKVKSVFTEGGKVDKSKIENHLQKSLGVLKEDGVFAFFIYQGVKEEPGRPLACQAVKLLKEVNVMKDIECEGDITQKLNKIRGALNREDRLDRLILAKKVLSRALAYAWYYARTLPEKKAEQKEEPK